MAWYDLDEKKETKTEYLARIKYEEIVCKSARSFREIVDVRLEKGVQYRIVTNQGFNAITVIQHIHENFKIDEVYIAVYRMNQQSVYKLMDIIGAGISCFILLSSFFRENKRYEKWCNDLILHSKAHSNVKLCFAWNHAKVFLAKTIDKQHIVFEGSGNLSDNARIEQYLIENNQTTYDFHKKWMDDILNQS